MTSSATPGQTIFAGTSDPSAKSSGERREAQTPMLQHYLAKKDCAQIAACWVKGEGIDWALLHEGQSPRRIELPTYPFLLKMQVHYQKNKHDLTATGDTIKEVVAQIKKLVTQIKKLVTQIKKLVTQIKKLVTQPIHQTMRSWLMII